ncbi:NAD(P)-dependent oxidoreductase [Chromatium okenii]|uniref:NAD-dependent epimerase/dehydratase family protein n=1 Tax=Chromatium okenii TaxID=61644 RepID=UPI0026EC6EC3|nr:NAD-dependent epimerase/dehydratase family protein [Chromatium okenii]MBV5307841.1 NAD-dependent epimerase/dehydratase family protein [Chromatium okenii]
MTTPLITVLGGHGFIGSHLLQFLKQQGLSYCAPDRNDATVFTQPLGHVIYCIGLTADFRTRPLDTVEAHICLLQRFIDKADFESFTYLSSTRVYAGVKNTQEEQNLVVNPNNASDLYNLSKLMGESLCLHCGRQNMKIARLSNIVGVCNEPTNFLTQLLEEGYKNGNLLLHTSLDSEKDYLGIDDTIQLLTKIALSQATGIFNIASGVNTKTAEIANFLAQKLGFKITVIENAPTWSFSVIDIHKIKTEFQFNPRQLNDYFPDFLDSYHHQRNQCHI